MCIFPECISRARSFLMQTKPGANAQRFSAPRPFRKAPNSPFSAPSASWSFAVICSELHPTPSSLFRAREPRRAQPSSRARPNSLQQLQFGEEVLVRGVQRGGIGLLASSPYDGMDEVIHRHIHLV